jgi:hypothetical protein
MVNIKRKSHWDTGTLIVQGKSLNLFKIKCYDYCSNSSKTG